MGDVTQGRVLLCKVKSFYMKKIKLLLLFLVISLVGFSQNFNKVYKSTCLKYSYQQQKWNDVMAKYPENMYITINGNDIKINNESQSHFKTYGVPEKSTYETHLAYSWDCLDKEGNSCTFIMKKFNSGDLVLSFLYSSEKIMFEYIIENE